MIKLGLVAMLLSLGLLATAGIDDDAGTSVEDDSLIVPDRSPGLDNPPLSAPPSSGPQDSHSERGIDWIVLGGSLGGLGGFGSFVLGVGRMVHGSLRRRASNRAESGPTPGYL